MNRDDNIDEKGEVTHQEQFHLLPLCVLNSSAEISVNLSEGTNKAIYYNEHYAFTVRV